jgi:hypothetical protein
VVLNTVEYNQKTGALLEDAVYRRLTKDPTEVVERKTILLKKSSLAEEVCKRLRPAGTRLPRIYGFSKIIKRESLLRPIVSNIGAPTHQLSKYLASIHRPTFPYINCVPCSRLSLPFLFGRFGWSRAFNLLTFLFWSKVCFAPVYCPVSSSP